MAKYYSSTFGKISGKHGTAVAVIMKDGSTYLREYKKPSNPRTDKQQAHRAKFALSSRALVPFNPIFKETMGITNGISIARSHAFKNAIVGEYPIFSMDYEKLMFSFGALEKLHDASAAINEGVIDIKWGFNKMYNCHNNDNVCLVVFNKENNQSIHLKDVALRSDKEVKISIYESWVDADLYLWAYVTNGDKMSDSVFVGNSVGTSRSLSGLCVCSSDNYQDNNCLANNNPLNNYQDEIGNTGSTTHYGFNQIVSFFIIMLHNLFSLFKQISIVSNVQIFLSNALSYTYISVVEYIDITNKVATRMFNRCIYSSKWRYLVYHYHLKYKYIFSPDLVPITSP